jgi:hypothetical protein
MAGHVSTRVLVDLLSDELARRSGILLSSGDIRALAVHVPHESYRVALTQAPDHVVDRASDFYSDLARDLRVAIGNLADDEPPTLRRMRVTQALVAAGHDPLPVFEAFGRLAVERPGTMIGEATCKEIQRKTGAPQHVVNAVFLLIADHLEREATPFTMASSRSWDGAIPLSRLFDAELKEPETDGYLDQRFLDYLAAREEHLDRIHWRNFERLCAEFFRRAGFQVVLGPGRRDGGVDIRVWNAEDDPAPFLLVQRKRYDSGRLVGIETVKALWSDVDFEGADGGLLATTSRITPEGKRLADARSYPLRFAEHARVREWARSMWRFSYDAPTRSLVPGTPLE